jgi:hypothetical protein
MSDPGLQLVSTLQSELQVEPEWCVPLERGFHWWPGHLAQRVWADPPMQIRSHRFSRVHIESDFLGGVAESDKVLGLVGYVNRLTTVSSVVFRPDEHRIRLHVSLCVSENNLPEVLRLARVVLTVQAADASARLNTDFQHPQLGDGVLMRLTLPVTATPEHTNLLNLLEAKEGAANADQLGGWCVDDNSPVFVTFVPTCLLEWDRLVSLVYDAAIRTQWAKALLVATAEA